MRSAICVPERELSFELGFQRGKRADKLRACLFEQCGGGDGPVSLNLDEEVRLQRVWDLVASEEDLRHGEKLAKTQTGVRAGLLRMTREDHVRSEHVAQGVILLHDFNRGSIRDLSILDKLYTGYMAGRQ